MCALCIGREPFLITFVTIHDFTGFVLLEGSQEGTTVFRYQYELRQADAVFFKRHTPGRFR